MKRSSKSHPDQRARIGMTEILLRRDAQLLLRLDRREDNVRQVPQVQLRGARPLSHADARKTECGLCRACGLDRQNPTPEQVAQFEAEEREAAAFVDAQWKAADEWIAAEWPHATDRERAMARSIWTELGRRRGDDDTRDVFRMPTVCTPERRERHMTQQQIAFLVLAVVAVSATLSACGGGSPAPERPITGAEYCKVRTDAGQCPVDEIGTKAPSTGGPDERRERQVTQQQLAFLVLAVVAVIAFFVTRKKNADTAPVPANIMDSSAWEIGPIMNGENASAGVPLHPTPHPDGWCIEIPNPSAIAGHVHYVTVPTGPLTGKTRVTLRCRIEAAPGVKLVPRNFPDAPSLLTLYFQRKGDDWSAKGAYEAFRWYASFGTVRDPRAGEYELEARFDQNWTAILSSSRESNPAGFQGAVDNAGRIGFVLGGGDGLGHGVYATGPARLVVTRFEVV
jgi:hypothetical protein